jgi:aminopeptidase N
LKIFLKIIILFYLLFTINAKSQDLFEGSKSHERSYDVLHYKLDINVDLEKKNIDGSVTTTLVPLFALDSIIFDAENIKIKEIKLDQNKLIFNSTNNKLIIYLNKKYFEKDTLKFLVKYECSPKNGYGLNFFKPDSNDRSKLYQCWSQGEEELNHFWFPCYDFPNDRMTSEMLITVNEKYTAISNGRLIEIKENKINSTKTFHWLQDKEHVTYLISFVIGEYEKISDKYNNIPVEYYVYKNLVDDAKRIFPETIEMIDFYSKKIGVEYPWDKYAQIIVQDFFGGMENTSATNLIDNIPDKRYYENDEKFNRFYSTIIAHELAHQWYGDLITCKNWEHLWLNEGFAEFMAGIFKEYKFGKDASKLYFLNELNSYININSKSRMVTASFRSNNVYQKGALILNMLRYIIGEDNFWKAMIYYSKKFSNRCVITKDFKESVEKITSKDLDWFFNQWVYKAGHPFFNVDYNYNKNNKILTLNVRQTQKQDSLTGIFKTPVDVKIITSNMKYFRTINIDSQKNSFEFSNIEYPLLVSFDPDNYIIKQIDFKKSTEEYIYQLRNDDNILGRMEAAGNLKLKCDTDEVYNTLKYSLLNDTSWSVRAEVLKSLSNSRREETIDLLFNAYKDKNSLVRQDIIRSLASFKKNKKVSQFLRNAMNDNSYNVITSVIQTIVSVDSSEAFDFLVQFIDKESFRNMIQDYILGALVKIRDERAVPYFVKYSETGKSRLAQNTCIVGLTQHAERHPELYDFFIKNLKSSHSYFRRMSVNGLGSIGDKKALINLEEMQKSETNSMVLESIKKALKKLNEK